MLTHTLVAVSFSEQSQYPDEQVDEIQIKLEGSHDHQFLTHLLVSEASVVVVPQHLHVIGNEEQEHHDTYVGDDPLNEVASEEEDVDDGRDDQCDETRQDKTRERSTLVV